MNVIYLDFKSKAVSSLLWKKRFEKKGHNFKQLLFADEEPLSIMPVLKQLPSIDQNSVIVVNPNLMDSKMISSFIKALRISHRIFGLASKHIESVPIVYLGIPNSKLQTAFEELGASFLEFYMFDQLETTIKAYDYSNYKKDLILITKEDKHNYDNLIAAFFLCALNYRLEKEKLSIRLTNLLDDFLHHLPNREILKILIAPFSALETEKALEHYRVNRNNLLRLLSNTNLKIFLIDDQADSLNEWVKKEGWRYILSKTLFNRPNGVTSISPFKNLETIVAKATKKPSVILVDYYLNANNPKASDIISKIKKRNASTIVMAFSASNKIETYKTYMDVNTDYYWCKKTESIHSFVDFIINVSILIGNFKKASNKIYYSIWKFKEILKNFKIDDFSLNDQSSPPNINKYRHLEKSLNELVDNAYRYQTNKLGKNDLGNMILLPAWLSIANHLRILGIEDGQIHRYLVYHKINSALKLKKLRNSFLHKNKVITDRDLYVILDAVYQYFNLDKRYPRYFPKF